MNIKIYSDNKIVPIDQVVANDYNPKLSYKDNSHNAIEFEKIKKSLENGQVLPVIVREIAENKYELINGYHRWMAMQELGYTEIEIKNLGQIDFDTAVSWALQTEDTKVPIDEMELAGLLKKIVTEEKPAEYWSTLLPYNSEVIKTKIELIDFNWNTDGETEGETVEPDSEYRFVFKVSPEDAEMCNRVLDGINKDINLAFVTLCREKTQ